MDRFVADDVDDDDMPRCPRCGHAYDVDHVIRDEYDCLRCGIRFQRDGTVFL